MRSNGTTARQGMPPIGGLLLAAPCASTAARRESARALSRMACSLCCDPPSLIAAAARDLLATTTCVRRQHASSRRVLDCAVAWLAACFDLCLRSARARTPQAARTPVRPASARQSAVAPPRALDRSDCAAGREVLLALRRGGVFSQLERGGTALVVAHGTGARPCAPSTQSQRTPPRNQFNT